MQFKAAEQENRMILSGVYCDYAGAGVRGQGGALEGNRNDVSVRRGTDFWDIISGTSFKGYEEEGKLINEAAQDGRKRTKEELFQLLSEYREEILEKLKSGNTGVKIPIGSLCLTEEEWEKLLNSFDDAQEKIREEVRAESGEKLPEKRPDTTVNGDRVLGADETGHDVRPLEEIVSGIDMEKVPADCFPGMQVITKTGDCNVSSGTWCRTDFPFWEYFKKGTTADALNNWQPSGPQPSMLDPKIQRNLSGIGAGKISILIPEKLQAKMDADPAYAQEIYRKVAKWKEDYDAWDNATAASLGMNAAEHQLSKSYCVQLDEDGNVGNFTVVSMGGEITQSGEDVEDNWLKRRNAAILFHRQHLARMGYTGLTGTAGIVTQEGEDSPLALLRAALAVGMLLEDQNKKGERTIV